MIDSFSARAVATEVLSHLERRREELVENDYAVKAAVEQALAPLRRAYADTDLPMSYFDAVEREMLETIPAKWRAVARPFTAAERRHFGVWRGGDVVARIALAVAGLIAGALVVAAPFIPIWWKWFPLAVALAGWFLPDLQTVTYRRRYTRTLFGIVEELGAAQPALDRHITVRDLLPPGENL